MIGDDGLTDAERQEAAARWEATAAKRPTQEELDAIKSAGMRLYPRAAPHRVNRTRAST